MALSLNALLKTGIQIKVVDVGASPNEGRQAYHSLLERGHAQVVGFEPEPGALAELNRRKGPGETYLPMALGDGKRHTLHYCAASVMTSLFKPNPRVIDLLHGFPEWARVVKTEEIATCRLDDVPEAAGFDLLKLDIQGAELMVLENAVAGLRTALFVQTEVEFMPLYTGQPLFPDVDLFLRRQGFVLHRFEQLMSRVVKPLLVNNDIYAGFSQLFWTDALYVRDFTRLELFTDDELLRLALILNDCYSSYDLVLLLLTEYDRRAGSAHGVTYRRDGLGVEAAK